MMRHRSIVFVGFVLLTAGTTALAGRDWDGEVFLEETHSMGRGGTLSLDSDRGGVAIFGDDRSDVLIRALCDEIDPEEARDLLKLTIEETGDGIHVRARMDEGSSFFGLFKRDHAKIRLEILVPRRADLDIRNGSGGVNVVSIEGSVRVDNGSGGISLEEISGNVTVDNGSGGIRLEAITGDVEIDNGSGGISASRLDGAVRVENSSGGVRLEEIEGELQIDNGSGGVRVEMAGRNYGVSVKSGSGGVVLRVPEDWGADLDLRSRSGDISLRGWDLSAEDVEEFHGQVGGGGAPITVRNGSGRVVVEAD
jgi:Toastrack DUF4097